jgi:hypothetical protein
MARETYTSGLLQNGFPLHIHPYITHYGSYPLALRLILDSRLREPPEQKVLEVAGEQERQRTEKKLPFDALRPAPLAVARLIP